PIIVEPIELPRLLVNVYSDIIRFILLSEVSSCVITLSFVYTVPKLTPANSKLNEINKGELVPINIKIPHIINDVNANIYKPFLVILDSNLSKEKFNANQATEIGNITKPLCKGERPISSCK